MELLRVDMIILTLLNSNNATGKIGGMALKEIVEEAEGSLTLSNLRLRIRKLYKAGYISEGLKSWNSKTYYITEKGIEVINNMM